MSNLPGIPDDFGTPVKGLTAVVVLSGGQDSVTCLGWALKAFETVYAVGFQYGQKHSVEIACATRICADLGVMYRVLRTEALQDLDDSALLVGHGGNVNAAHPRNPNLPASFVPNRNALFLTLAHAYAQTVGASHVVTGISQTDYSGYPDCRGVFMVALEKALNLGYETDIRFVAPLLQLNKADTFELADRVGVLETVIAQSHTCYNGDHKNFHTWGFGCGECPACKLRAAGWFEYQERKNV